MKVGANTLRPGNIISHNNRSWRVVKLQHVKPGKGGAFLQVELKDIISGSKLNERFRSAETIEKLHLEGQEYQFLYAEGDDQFLFMHCTTFEQQSISLDLVGEDAAQFLQEGMIVTIDFLNGDTPVAVSLPDHVVVTIESADAVVKGQTASSSYKPAILENGFRVLVPPHVESGTKIVINTSDFSYVERYKE